jgi:hypothetical protein
MFLNKKKRLNVIPHLMRDLRHVLIPVIGSSIIILSACSGPQSNMEGEYMPFDTMVQVMADIHVIEAKTNLGKSRGIEEGKQNLYRDYEQVFFNHGITQKKFEDSYKYYSSNPEQFNTLFEKTIEELNKRQALIGK